MLSVVVIGLPCSGKTVIADALAQSLGWLHIECSAVLRELRQEQGSGDEPLADFAERIPPDAVGQRVASKLAGMHAVISGPRSRADLLYVVEAVGAIVVLVDTDEAVRVQPAQLRARDQFASRGRAIIRAKSTPHAKPLPACLPACLPTPADGIARLSAHCGDRRD